ncbi:extracellular solute-binding protein [Photobacterium sp. GB-1]|uniref:extracellular solute-binding protein n=1 Tax=Photobacterium sp. GB-1 TaxID=2022111 RepID=UPI000D16D1E0|nr:extracellular solute-binding protein [Photobacterium sp. GB-1]PSV50956.1 ABC transporter substrate-binding protein [Photobacterium sp. GB-1]
MKNNKYSALTLIALSMAAISPNTFAAQLPSDMTWVTNLDEPLFASPDAQRGGTYRTFMRSFPQTLRSVGPDANSGLRQYFMDEAPKLVQLHPTTGEWIPQLATEWAFGDDHKSVYFKLDPNARWSDGKKVTAEDYLFMLKYYRSKDIIDPWYNDFFINHIENVEKIDDYTIVITSKVAKSDDELLYMLSLPSNGVQPRPAHYFVSVKDENNDGMDDNFVRKYNFKTEPTTGPYYVDKVKKGKSITFKHVGDEWWGYNNRYYKNRYNVDKIRIKVIRDQDIAKKHFEKGDLDSFILAQPELWHEKSNTKAYQNGYVHKLWGYNEAVQGAGGLWMNTAKPLLDDLNIRKGITYATDYDGLIKNVLRGDYLRKPHGLGTGHGGFDSPTRTPPTFEPEKAIIYFEKAGFSTVGADGIRMNDEGQRLSFAVTYSRPARTPRLAYLKEQAKQAGLELTLNLIDGSSAFKYILEKKHELAYLTMGGGKIPAYWEYLHSVNAKPQTNNHTNYRSPEMDKKIAAFIAEFDTKKKQSISHDIQKMVSDAYVIVPGYMAPFTREAYWRWMQFPSPVMTKDTDYVFSNGGYLTLGTFWINSDVKKETKTAMKKGESFDPVVIIDDSYKP